MKTLSYNRIKAIQLFASLFLILAYIPTVFKISFIPESVASIISISAMLGYIFAITLGMGTMRSKKIVDDELSKANNAEASNIAISAITVLLMITSLVTQYLVKIELELTFELVFCIVLLISVLRDSFYFYLEKRGDGDAGAED